MTSYTYIRDVGNSLKSIISNNIEELSTDNSIIFDSPGEVTSGTVTRLSIFLYKIEPNPYTRNLDDVAIGETQLRSPPASIDLNYMFTPYSEYRETEFILLEKMVQLFHDTGVLKGDLLQDSLVDSVNQEIRIVPVTHSLDDLHKLWGVFPNKTFKLQIFYKLTPVYIPSSKVRDVTRGPIKQIKSKIMKT